MGENERSFQVRSQLFAAQRLLNKQRAGRELTTDETKRLIELIGQLNKTGLGDMLIAMPGIRFSGLPMY